LITQMYMKKCTKYDASSFVFFPNCC